MLIYPELLVALSLAVAAVEDYKTKRVHYVTWIPFSVGAIWILAISPLLIFPLFILGFPILLLSKAQYLGGAEVFGFSAIALLGSQWCIITALLAFCFIALVHMAYLGMRKKNVMKEHVAWVPYLAFGFAVALIL